MPHVISTLSNDTCYAEYDIPETEGVKVARPATQKTSVTVKGGANVNHQIIGTPKGQRTEVTDSQADFLAKHPLFQKHEDDGFVKIFGHKVNANKAARDLTMRDTSAPLNEAQGDFEKGGRAAGVAPIDSKVQ